MDAGGHHEYIGRCSVYQRDTMMHACGGNLLDVQ